MTTEFNKNRLDYLLNLYDMSSNELLPLLNKNRKRLYTIEDIDGQEIKLSPQANRRNIQKRSAFLS